jgi:RNA polymerase sigma-70 factor (ECF subfamily)
LTDEKVIAAVLAGDTAAFRKIVERYESKVAAVVHGMLGPGPEAEDVGQEVFIRFYQSLNRFRGESGVSTYLTRIAINLSLNELKSRKRRFGLFLRGSDEMKELPDHSAGNPSNPQDEAVRSAIQRLKPELRCVVVLRHIEGYSTEETAAILKIPVGTVLSRQARAKSQLKKLLSMHLGGS